jgi:hypothetical protein
MVDTAVLASDHQYRGAFVGRGIGGFFSQGVLFRQCTRTAEGDELSAVLHGQPTLP